QALSFSIEIGVLPKARLGEYLDVEAPRREPAVAPEQLQDELEAVRERLARLHAVERPAAAGDFVVIDYVGRLPGEGGGGRPGEPFAGGEARDQLLELGSGRLIPGFEEALVGASAGDRREVPLTFPPDYPNEQLAGREASFEVTVKEVKAKELPPLDDDLALDSGFDDLEQLREEISQRLLAADEASAETEFRQAALDAVVAGAELDLTPELIDARAREMWERMLHSLSHRGITREGYLRLSGNREEEVLAELRPEAELALRREAVITAVVAAEQISPSDEDVLGALAATAEREGVEPAELLEQLRSSGRLEELREELAARQAIDLIAERAKPIEPGRARAREQLWTPEKAVSASEQPGEPDKAPARLWTPDR
ncbi:MAG TPA: trigger factor, partial [Solirubrobacteraceae bacterium]|nr:trigger factor [Solirubrobacteraceae bacterium]